MVVTYLQGILLGKLSAYCDEKVDLFLAGRFPVSPARDLDVLAVLLFDVPLGVPPIRVAQVDPKADLDVVTLHVVKQHAHREPPLDLNLCYVSNQVKPGVTTVKY